MISIGKLCKEVGVVFITPYKHSSIEAIKQDENIKNPYEKHAKCLILALGIILINLLMLKIDIIIVSSEYIRQKYNNYINSKNMNRTDSDYIDYIPSTENTSQIVNNDVNNENEDESEESSDTDEREKTDYDKENESE